MADEYKTLSALSEGIYREKMSRFLAFAIPVDSVEQAKETISHYQKKFLTPDMSAGPTCSEPTG